MNPLMRQGALGALLLAMALCLVPTHVPAQASAGKRRIAERSPAVYPSLARSMALEGLVKLEVLVAPDGTVKSVDVKGGHPVLVQAAVNTVRRWRWEPAAHESRELVEIKFSAE